MQPLVPIGLLSLLLPALPVACDKKTPPVAVFADLDGVWEGTFVRYDLKGREDLRIAVRQEYRTIDDTTQEVRMEDRFGDGKVVRGRGKNVATRDGNGDLHLLCVVEKDDGERVKHSGRVVKGPDGEQEIVWSSASPGRFESFIEAVRRDGETGVYTLFGTARHGDTTVLMQGRYTRRPR